MEGLTLRREDVVMLQHHTFVNLKSLSLSCYHDENVAFPSDFLLHRFPNLEELYVSCNSFDEIFPEDASGHGRVSLKALGNLKRLRLNKLCNLRRVWRDGSLMAEILKQIEDLFIWQCPSLSIVFHPDFIPEIDGIRSRGLRWFSSYGDLLKECQLQTVGAMEDVVTDDENGAREIAFPKLEQLILDRLPRLESFSLANCAFRFPSLVLIAVKRCPKMDTFCKGALRTPKLNGVYLSFDKDVEWHWEGDLNTTIQTLST
ncbi:hypothetical protein NL676_030638 [Syzygium grande]|nr:hypothetical protein NL676_030638 [Syzygium grande]